MSYLEQLSKSKDKPQVAYQEFALSVRKYHRHLFCFFEGKDNAYYVPRIKRYTESYHPIGCGGRDAVLGVHTLIANRVEYKDYKKAFFIDRDFNPPLAPQTPPVFETPCYSIENFYVSIDVFKEILKNSFQLSPVSNQDSFDNCVSTYTDRQKEFHAAITLFDAWYACMYDVRAAMGKQTGVQLEDKFFKGFIETSLASVSSNYNLEKLKNKFPDATEIEERVLQQKIEQFRQCDQSKVFRGKYELQFLVQMIHLLLKDSSNDKTVLKNKVNFAFGDGSGLNNIQAINIFSAYAETPEILSKYLETVTK